MLSKWPRRALVLIIVFALVSRVYNLQYPATYYFDEVYHAMTAKLMAHNDQRAFEWTHGETIEPGTYVDWLHPPLAKYTQALAIRAVGETAVGWRLSSAIFGVGVVWLTAVLAQRLFAKRWLSVLAAGLTALDGLLLTQSRIAMNDIHVVFGFLLTLNTYVWYRQRPAYWRLLVVGLTIGLTIATKWSGAFVWAVVLLFESSALVWVMLQEWSSSHQWRTLIIKSTPQLLLRAVALAIVPLLIYVMSYMQMFLQGKDFAYFVELHQQIFGYQFSLEATHPYQSRPMEWVLDLRPTWYFVDYADDGTRSDIYNTGNPFVFIFGLLAASASTVFVFHQLYHTYQGKKSHKNTALSKNRSVPTRTATLPLALSSMKVPPSELFSLSLLLITYALCWVPWIFSPRIMFFYHYAPAVPLLAIMIAFWCDQIWIQARTSRPLTQNVLRVSVILFVALTMTFFIVWYPQWVGIPMTVEFKETVYFAVPSWR